MKAYASFTLGASALRGNTPYLARTTHHLQQWIDEHRYAPRHSEQCVRGVVSDMHDRMPSAVPPDNYDLWLDPDMTDFEMIREQVQQTREERND
jgi:hypothetical protein